MSAASDAAAQQLADLQSAGLQADDRFRADGRWQHKADRRVYANFRQVAGVPLWEKVKVPALVIKGEHSARFAPDVLAEIRARAPQVQMAEVPASDHHITLDNPQGFVDVVQKFLRT